MKTFRMREADARKWRRLVRETRRVAADPFAHAGELIAAAATARRAVAPDSVTQSDVTSPLIKLAETYGDLSAACRVKAAGTMAGLAERLALTVGEPGGTRRIAGNPAEPQLYDLDTREPRKDIFG